MPMAVDVLKGSPAQAHLVRGDEIWLTWRESDLLSLLAWDFGKVVAHDDLQRRLLGGLHRSDDPRTLVYNHAANLRKKMAGSGLEIETVTGEGYRLVRPPPMPHEHLAFLDRPGESFDIVHYRHGEEAGRLRLGNWLAAYHLATLIQERVDRKVRRALSPSEENS